MCMRSSIWVPGETRDAANDAANQVLVYLTLPHTCVSLYLTFSLLLSLSLSLVTHLPSAKHQTKKSDNYRTALTRNACHERHR